MEKELENIKTQIGSKELNLKRLQHEIKTVTNHITDAKEAKKDFLNSFGRSMPQVKNEIEAAERAGKWRGNKPVGPIGNQAPF